jgi:hypothetical protein
MGGNQNPMAVLVLFILVISLGFFWFQLIDLLPSAHIEEVDDNGTVWIHLSHIDISENTTIYVYYGDNVSSKQMWILK